MKSEKKGSQVIGFTTINLQPLLAGMPLLCGWYNVVDFTGLCQGQIKCGVAPLHPVGKRSDILLQREHGGCGTSSQTYMVQYLTVI